MTQTRESVAVGIVGTGGLGAWLGERLVEMDDAEVAAIAEIGEDNREHAGERLSVPSDRRFAEYDQMYDAVDLDAVVIVTPHTLHYEHVVAAFEHEFAVYCEKPLVTGLERARDLATRTDNGDHTLIVGWQRHFLPAVQAMRERFAERDPDHLTARLVQDWVGKRESTESPWRLDPELAGGGLIYDGGSHLLDLLLWTTGLTPESVRAEMSFYDGRERLDVESRLFVDFAERASGTISIYGDGSGWDESLDVHDDAGSVRWDGDLTFVDEYGVETRPSFETPAHDGGIAKIRTLVDAVLDGSPPAEAPTVRDALRVTALVEAAYESASKDGERVAVDL